MRLRLARWCAYRGVSILHFERSHGCIAVVARERDRVAERLHFALGMSFFRTSLALVTSLGFVMTACSPSSDEISSGGAGSGGPSTGKGTPASTNSGILATGAQSTGTDMSCASASIEAKLTPLTMYIMFDKSGSMGQNNKWSNASAALKAFFQDPGAAGLSIALRFFPDGDCDGDQCSVSACATPQVDAQVLSADSAPNDTQEEALVQAVDSQSPGGNTPIFAALSGATQWGSTYLAAHPDHKVVAILVTDGEPQGCDENIGDIADVAASGHAQGIDTFTVGLQGSNENSLNQIATAGGSMQGFFIGNGNTEQDLIAALQAIQGQAIACEIPMPVPENGETVNPLQVNVDYTPSNGSPSTIGNVSSAAACTAAGGWYYDDPANPTKILLCPATCDSVQGDDGAKLDIVLGCDTIPA